MVRTWPPHSRLMGGRHGPGGFAIGPIGGSSTADTSPDAGFSLTAPVLDWDDDTADATPDFSISLTDPLANDDIVLEWDNNSDFSSPISSDTNILDAGEISSLPALAFTTGSLANGTYYFRAKHGRGGSYSAWSNTETVTIAVADLPVPTYVSSQIATGANANWTATGFTLGAPSTEELLVIVVAGVGGAQNMTSANLDPDTGVDIAGAEVQDTLDTTGTARNAAIYQFVLPIGVTSWEIDLVYAGNIFSQPYVSCWTVPTADMNSTTKVDSDGAGFDATTGGNLDISTSVGGFIIAAGVNRRAAGATGTITGDETFDERADGYAGNSQHVLADASGTVAGTNDNTITFAFSLSGDIVAVAASWR